MLLNKMKALMMVFSLTLLLVASGCGDDKPEGPPPGVKKKAAEAEKKAAANAQDEKQAATGQAGTEAKSDVEKIREEGREVEAEERAKAVEIKKELASQAKIEKTLRKVTAYGVTGPVDKVRDQIVDLLPLQVRQDARKGFQEAINDLASEGKLTNLDFLDLSRGIGFAFEGKDRPLIAIPILSDEEFLKALPEGLEPDENKGYALGESYVMPYGKYLFVSDSFRSIDLIEGDLKLELTRLETDKVLKMVLGGSSLKTLLSSALDEVERSMSETMPMQQEQKEFLAKFFNFAKELMGEIDKITVTADLTVDDLFIRYEIETVSGSRLAQSFSALKPGTFNSAGYLPGKSYLVMAQNVAAAAATPFMPRYVDLVATAWKLEEGERAEFAKLYARLITMFGPDAAFGIYSDSSFPVSFTSVTETRNGLTTRDQIYEFYMMVLNKVIAQLPADQKKVFASGSLKQVVNSFAPVLQNMGIGLKMDTEDYRGGKIDYMIMTLDWDRLSLPPSAAWVKQVIRSRIGGALAFSEEHMVFTFGPNPIVRAKEVMDRTPGLKLVEMAGPEVEQGLYVGVFAVSFERLMSALLEIGVVADAIGSEPWVGKVQGMKDLLVTSGLREGGMWVEAGFGIKAVVQAFESEIIDGIRSGDSKPEVAPAN